MKIHLFSRSWVTAILLICFHFVFVAQAMAGTEVSGIVKEVGYNKFIMTTSGSDTDVRYYTGRETIYTPSNYRVVAGDAVTVTYYEKKARGGNTILAVSSLKLKQKDPNHTAMKSPAIGVIDEVGRVRIRITFPKYKTTVSLGKQRGMTLSPAGYVPQAGDKVEVHFQTVTNRWTQRSGDVITVLKKIK